MNNAAHKYKILLINLISFQVHAEEISGNNGYVELFFCAKKLDDKVSSTQLYTVTLDSTNNASLALKLCTCEGFIFIYN